MSQNTYQESAIFDALERLPAPDIRVSEYTPARNYGSDHPASPTRLEKIPFLQNKPICRVQIDQPPDQVRLSAGEGNPLTHTFGEHHHGQSLTPGQPARRITGSPENL
jgi:hypothetical protein